MSHLILVEDDGSLRGTLRRTFERRGHEVKEAGDLASLSEWLGGQETFDWAVVDLGLPDGSGLDAISALRSSNPEIRIAVLTGYGSISSAVDAMRMGANDYLTKPADVDQILAVLEDAHDQAREAGHQPASLQRVEWEHIQRVLRDCEGNVTRAAAKLGLHRRTLQRKLSYRPPRD